MQSKDEARGGNSPRSYMSTHTDIINNLVATVPGFRKAGMVKALTAAFIAIEYDFDVRVAFVPDGYVIDPQAKKVTVYEVVCTNDITKAKLTKLLNFWFEMDSCSWNVELKIVREGQRVTQTISDEALCTLFYDWNPWLGEEGRPVPGLLGAGQYDLA